MPVHGRRAAHAQHPPVPRAARLHRQPRRGQGDHRRRLARRPLAKLAPELETVEHVVVVGDGDLDALPGALLATRSCSTRPASGEFDWPEIDERAAAALCYTSGTTGNPKGVVYSHRSMSLHSMTICTADAVGLSSRDRVLADRADVPRQRLGPALRRGAHGRRAGDAGPFLQAEPLARLIEAERATLLAGVPTIWSDCCATSTSTAATSTRCAAGSAAARRCRARSWRASRTPRRAHRPGLGDDRDVPARRRRPAARRAWTRARSTGPTARTPGPAGARRRRRRVRLGRRGRRRARGARAVDHRRATTRTRPATTSSDDGWLRTGDVGDARRAAATSASPTAPRTSSSPAASGSRRSSSRTR